MTPEPYRPTSVCTTSFLCSAQVAVGKGDGARWHRSPCDSDSEEYEEGEHLQGSAADAGGIKAEGDGPLPLPRAGRRIGAAPLTLLKMSCFAFSSALPLPAGSNITLGTKALANSDPFAVRSADVSARCCTPPPPSSLVHPQKKSQMQWKWDWLCLCLSQIQNAASVDLWDGLKVEPALKYSTYTLTLIIF